MKQIRRAVAGAVLGSTLIAGGMVDTVDASTTRYYGPYVTKTSCQWNRSSVVHNLIEADIDHTAGPCYYVAETNGWHFKLVIW